MARRWNPAVVVVDLRSDTVTRPSEPMRRAIATAEVGDDVLVGSQSHILHHEAAGASALGGIALRAAPNDDRGRIEPGSVEELIRPPGATPVTRLVCLENTQNRCGGAVLPLTPSSSAAA